MKVIHLSNFAYQYTVPLVNSISKRCDCILLSPDSNHGSIFLEKLSEKVIHEKYPNIRISNFSNIFKAKEILNTIKKYNPDVLHIQHHGDMWLSYLMKWVSSNFNIVNTVHDMEPHIGFERFHHKYHSSAGISISDKFVVHGESLKNQFLRNNSLDENLINIISHGNYDIYKEISTGLSKEEPNTVLFFGKLYEYKGLKYLLEAVPKICEKIPDFRLILAVHGEPFSKYKKYLPDSYMKHLEIIEDYIPDTEVGRLFSRVAVVVLPYISASQSGVVPLSYSFAKPVIATDVGALSEIILNGKTGFIGKPRDKEYLSEKIIYLLENPEVRLELGNQAKEYSTTKLSWDKIGEEYFKLYKSFNYEK